MYAWRLPSEFQVGAPMIAAPEQVVVGLVQVERAGGGADGPEFPLRPGSKCTRAAVSLLRAGRMLWGTATTTRRIRATRGQVDNTGQGAQEQRCNDGRMQLFIAGEPARTGAGGDVGCCLCGYRAD